MKVLLFQFHANDPLSWAIKQVTRSPYTHAALLVDEKTNMIVEAFYPHVRQRPLGEKELAGIDVFAVAGITPAQEEATVDYALKAMAAAEAYSLENLFRFLPAGRTVLGEAQDNSPSASVFCSQFVFDAVHRGGGIQLLNAHSYEIAPGYLAWSPLLIPQPPLKPTCLLPFKQNS